jgi:precorrin-2 dehydrogenase/sirohydrochlorin ferrochelatase
VNRYFPLYTDIRDQLCLVVGAGSVAERRVRGLRESGGRIRVVSPEALPIFEAWHAEGEIDLHLKPFSVQDLEGVFLVIAATNLREVNAKIAEEAKSRGILVNITDNPEEGNFIVPSTVRRGALLLSVATGGNNPSLSMRLASEMEQRFSPHYGDFVELLGRMRVYIKEHLPEAEQRAAHRRLLNAETELCEVLEQGSSEEAYQHAIALLAKG